MSLLLPPPLLGGIEGDDDDNFAVGIGAGVAGGSVAGGIVAVVAFAADADGTAIPRILERIRERRSAFTLVAISSIVSPIVVDGLCRIYSMVYNI